jgi:hypothetical protein
MSLSVDDLAATGLAVVGKELTAPDVTQMIQPPPHVMRRLLGPVDKPRPDADASDQDESHEAGSELVISGGDAPLLFQMANEALNP